MPSCPMGSGRPVLVSTSITCSAFIFFELGATKLSSVAFLLFVSAATLAYVFSDGNVGLVIAELLGWGLIDALVNEYWASLPAIDPDGVVVDAARAPPLGRPLSAGYGAWPWSTSLMVLNRH
jgi:hypothetical protein